MGAWKTVLIRYYGGIKHDSPGMKRANWVPVSLKTIQNSYIKIPNTIQKSLSDALENFKYNVREDMNRLIRTDK